MSRTLKEIAINPDLTQIINGEEVMTPSPFGFHQRITGRLFMELQEYAEKNDQGEIFISPLDVIFEENFNRLQPDLFFVKKENLGIVKDWIRGTPDLVLEVVSKGSVTLDTVTKKSIYEKYKVPELWLVFPEQECIEVFAWENGRYSLFSTSDEFGKIKSRILTGFEMEIMRIFRKK